MGGYRESHERMSECMYFCFGIEFSVWGSRYRFLLLICGLITHLGRSTNFPGAIAFLWNMGRCGRWLTMEPPRELCTSLILLQLELS